MMVVVEYYILSSSTSEYGVVKCALRVIIWWVQRFRQVRENTWTLCSNHVEPTERIYTVTDLMPSTEYELKITAHNNAGDMVAIYNFTTYTLTGGKTTNRSVS